MSLLFSLAHPSHVALAHSLKREFGTDVVTLVPWQYLEQDISITEQEKAEIGPWYSLPGYYFANIGRFQAMSWEELDAEQSRIEHKLGIGDNTMRTYFDRDFTSIGDYRTSRLLQLVNLSLAETILDENDIECVLLTRELYIWQLLLDAALFRQIPCMSWNTCRHVGARIFGRTSSGRQLGMPEAFEKLVENPRAFPPEDLAAADRFYAAFASRPVAENNVHVKERSLSRCIKNVATQGLSSIRRSMRLYRNNAFDRFSGRLESPYGALARWPGKAVSMYRLCHTGFLDQHPDMDRKFLYVPLHAKPEVADMYFGKDYAHHAAFITDLAKRIPSDCMLYVKDHPFMVGRRPMAFYAELKKLHNVDFVGPYVGNYELIRKARATVTVTGTAGWEAYLMNRPVVVLGDCIYNFLPGVLYGNLRAPDFPERLTAYLDTFEPDEAERRAALRACYVSSYDLGCEFRDPRQLAAHFDRFAEIVHEMLGEWGAWIIENEPMAVKGRKRGERSDVAG